MSIFPRGIWLSLAAIAAMLGLQTVLPGGVSNRESPAAPPPSASGTPGPLAVDLVGTGAIELTQFDEKGVRTTVLVRNDDSRDVKVRLLTFLIDRRGWSFPWNESADVKVDARKTLPVRLTVPLPAEGSSWWPDQRLPARGVVVLRAQDAKSAIVVTKTRDLLLNQKQPSPAEWILTMSGLVAGLIVLTYGLVFSGSSNVPTTASTPTWTPDSWSTNLAIGGALVTALVGITTLPAQTHYAAKVTYTTLSAFFAALIVLAPAVYGLLKVDRTPSQAGALRIFAFASAITVWATVGQLGTAGLLFLELSDARMISRAAAATAAVIAAVIALLVVLYAIRAINSCLQPGEPKPVKPGEPKPVQPAEPKPGAPAPPPAPALRLL